MRNGRGFTLIEMLIAIAVFLVVLTASVRALSFQSRAFSRGTDEMGMLQNLRYGVEQLKQDLRMAGANAPDRQAAVVYAGPSTFSFNGDIVSNVVGDISAVYIDPGATAGEVSAWPLASATVIPGSSPAFNYPLVDMSLSAAETITYWFTGDDETARTDDFVLVRRVNDRPPETLVRSVLAPGTGTFFKYWYLNPPSVSPSHSIRSRPSGAPWRTPRRSMAFSRTPARWPGSTSCAPSRFTSRSPISAPGRRSGSVPLRR